MSDNKNTKAFIGPAADMTTLAVDMAVFQGVPIFSLGKIAWDTARASSKSLSQSKFSATTHVDQLTVTLLMLHLMDSAKNPLYRSTSPLVRKNTREQALKTPKVTEKDLINRIHPEFDTYRKSLISNQYNLPELIELSKTAASIPSFKISCSAIFPLALAALLSMNSQKRFGTSLNVQPVDLIGAYQIISDLSAPQGKEPDIMITANSPFWMLGPDFPGKWRRYKLISELHDFGTIEIRKPIHKTLFRKSAPTAYFDNSVTEQNILERGIQKAIGISAYEELLSETDQIEFHKLIAWQPMYWFYWASGWCPSTGTEHRSPVSVFVRNDVWKSEKEAILNFSRLLFHELDFCRCNINYMVSTLLNNEAFEQAYRAHYLSGFGDETINRLRRAL
ncbi:MAG: hypothetical protein AAGG45_08385 [Pseudomonadota bacterium]